MNFEKLREAIKNAFGSEITTQQAEELGKINSVIDTLETENNKFIEDHNDLRIKYIDLVKSTSFPSMEEEKQEESKGKTFIECLEEVAKSKK